MKKRILAILTTLCMLVTLFPVSAGAATYGDTANHWAESAIDRWSDSGVVQGSEGNFNPDGNMTRAQAATVFVNLLGLEKTADLSDYTDVGNGGWYDDAISKCVAAGILSGVGDGKMNPDGTITREMFFVMFARALGIKEEPSSNSSMSDSGSVSSWAEGSVNALLNKGYVSGVTESEIGPALDINRASVMKLLDNTVVVYADKPGETVTVPEGKKGIVIAVADNVTVEGSVQNLVVPTPNVNVTVNSDSAAENIVVSGHESTVTVTNTSVESVSVSGENSKIVLADSNTSAVDVTGKNATVETTGTTTVESINLDAKAEGSTVNTGAGTSVGTVTSDADSAEIKGEGKVDKAEVSGSNNKIDTAGTSVSTSGSAEGTTSSNGTVLPPSTGTTDPVTPPVTPAPPVTPSTPSSGGGSSHSHNYTYTDNGDGTHTGRCTRSSCAVRTAAHDTNGEGGACSVCQANPGEAVVSLKNIAGDVTYYSVDEDSANPLAKAVAAAGSGDVVTLLSNIKAQLVIPAEKNITLNLNGNTLSRDDRYTVIINKGNLEISGDKEGSKVSSANGVAVAAGNNSVTTIKSGTFESVEGAVITGTSTGAKVTIDGGSFSASDNSVIAGNGTAREGNPNIITINNGTFTGNIKTAGYIACGIYAPWKDIITVNGGDFTINNGIGVVARAGQTTINGGSFICNGTAKGKVGDKNFDMDAAQSLYFDASNPSYPAYNSETDFITVTGGTFSSKPSDYIASGYAAALNADNKWEIVPYASLFAGGDGTANNPYQIENVAQLRRIESGADSEHLNHYVLNNNLDLKDYSSYGAYMLENAVFDGADHTIYCSVEKSFYGVFAYAAGKATIKNLTYDLTNMNNSGWAADCVALVYDIACVDGDILIENVTVTGSHSMDGNNGLFVLEEFMLGGKLTFKDCTYAANMTGNSYNACFIGWQGEFLKVNGESKVIANDPATITFDGCSVTGEFVSNRAAIIAANGSYAYNRNYVFKNNRITGTVRGTEEAKYFTAVSTQPASDLESKASESFTITSAIEDVSNVYVGATDASLAITKDADNNLKITASDNSAVTKYVVEVGMYTRLYTPEGNNNGTFIFSVKQEINADDLTDSSVILKAHGFADAGYNGITETSTDASGNEYITVDDKIYYVVRDHISGEDTGYVGAPGAPGISTSTPHIIRVKAYVGDTLYSSAIYK